jgi:archaeosine-15-forming tRNA-guanine transglycosylase
MKNKQKKAKILVFIFGYPFSFSIGDALTQKKILVRKRQQGEEGSRTRTFPSHSL